MVTDGSGIFQTVLVGWFWVVADGFRCFAVLVATIFYVT